MPQKTPAEIIDSIKKGKIDMSLRAINLRNQFNQFGSNKIQFSGMNCHTNTIILTENKPTENKQP